MRSGTPWIILICYFFIWTYWKIWNWGSGGWGWGNIYSWSEVVNKWNRGNRLGTTTRVKIFIINSQNDHIEIIISIQSLRRRQHPISSDNHIFLCCWTAQSHKNLRETSVYIIFMYVNSAYVEYIIKDTNKIFNNIKGW